MRLPHPAHIKAELVGTTPAEVRGQYLSFVSNQYGLRSGVRRKDRTSLKMRNRKTFFLATAAIAAAVATSAAAANPVVTLSSIGDPNTLPTGQQLIADFNNAADPDAVLVSGFELTLNGATVGVNEGGSGYSGTLPNDPTHYLTIPTGKSATLTSLLGLSDFSFYMGSPDTFNSIQFLGANGYNVTLSGGQITQGYTGQAWSWGQRINFNFGDDSVTQVILRSTGNSFEVDNFAAGVAAVPEPTTWALMIMGFGSVGAMVRRRRTAYALA